MSKGIAPASPGSGNLFFDQRVTSNFTGADSSESSRSPGRPGIAYGEHVTRASQRVRFGSGEALDNLNNRYTFSLRSPDDTPSPNSTPQYPPPVAQTPPITLNPSNDSPSRQTYLQAERFIAPSNVNDTEDTPTREKLLPPKMPPSTYSSGNDKLEMNDKLHLGKEQLSAKEREARLSRAGSFSAPCSTLTSPTINPINTLDTYSVGAGQIQGGILADNIPLLDFGDAIGDARAERPKLTATKEAHNLVRQHIRRGIRPLNSRARAYESRSGAVTPEAHQHEGYVKAPQQFRGGILSSLLKLYNPLTHTSNDSPYNYYPSIASTTGSPIASGRTTPKWYKKSVNTSTTSLGLLAASGASIATPVAGPSVEKGVRPKPKHWPHSDGVTGVLKNFSRPNANLEEEIKITIHIAETLARQKYILKLCRALMLYGAPTHRLEEYMKMTSRVLEMDGQFLYIPGCMIVSFGDSSTHTSEMQIVRTNQGVDLGKLHDTHLVYKEVVHDIIDVEEATHRLSEIMNRKPKHSSWILVPVYGIASAAVGPFGFKARFIDIPILFLLGCILGFLQLIVAPSSELYSNVFEISAAILTSFLARAFGSIQGGSVFCFSALAQASIALILPGYIILCGSLELQSRNIVAGSVRMFYAIIYSLFLGFGITIGSTLYGLFDQNATSATTCDNPLPWQWNFLFVPFFAGCLLVISQARWKQAPAMIAIAMAGYIVNFFSGRRFASQPQVSNAMGAFSIGILGNLYSRIGHGLAFAAMLPAIFVQVPSGLAAQGSLISGIQNADQVISNHGSNTSTTSQYSNVVMDMGFSMIQIAIGISVGLFTAALVVYPFGKKRSGLFSF